MKLLFIGDTHFRRHSSRYRVDQFYENQINKLEQILKLGQAENAAGFVFLGDVFNTPREPYELTSDILARLRSSTIPSYTIMGNHDIIGYNLSTLRKSPLGILVKSGAMTLLEKDLEFAEEKLVLKGIHYTSTYDEKAYNFNKYENYLRVVATHNMIIPQESAPFDFIHPDTIKTDANLVFCGHYHLPFDYIANNSALRTRYINPGVPIRWTTNEASMSPKIAVLTWNAPTYSVKYLHLEHRPADQAFNLVASVAAKQHLQETDSFVQALQSTEFVSTNLEATIVHYGQQYNIEPRIIEELLNRVKDARGKI